MLLSALARECRSGGLVATAWAAMRHIGAHGYCDITKAMIEAAEDFAACVRTVPELQVMGSPMMTIVAFKSIKRTFDVYQVRPGFVISVGYMP